MFLDSFTCIPSASRNTHINIIGVPTMAANTLVQYVFGFIFSIFSFLYIPGGKISCISIDGETGASSEVDLNTGHLLQALIGCPALPSSITEGIITFDHHSDYLTTVNTCAPSINFSQISYIKNYSSFEELMKNVMVGAYGFGRE